MHTNTFYSLLHKTPVISAVKSAAELEKSLVGAGKIIFVLFGDILNISSIVSQIKDAEKLALVHIDLIDGLSSRDIAVDFLAENTNADGILSTKANLIRRAKAIGMLTIQRFFVLDSMALKNVDKHLLVDCADAIEILPGAMPKVIRQIAGITKKPIIAGGLISDREDVKNALDAGAVSVSSSHIELGLM